MKTLNTDGGSNASGRGKPGRVIARGRFRPALATASLSALLALSAPALATPSAPCDDRGTMLEKLQRGYGETVREQRRVGSYVLLELLISPDGAWTIIKTAPDGLSCIAASGKLRWSET